MNATISKKKNQVYQIPDCADKRMHFRREQLQSFRVAMAERKYGKLGLVLSRDDNTLPKKCAAAPQANQALLLDMMPRDPTDCTDLRINLRWERRRSFRITMTESNYGKGWSAISARHVAKEEVCSSSASSHGSTIV